MSRAPLTGSLLAGGAALMYGPYLRLFQNLHAQGVPGLAIVFHSLFWPALVGMLLLFLSGRTGELKAFDRQQTYIIVLAAAGGYGFWLLQAQAAVRMDASSLRLMVAAAPLMVAVLSMMGREGASGWSWVGLVMGFVGCILILKATPAAAEYGGRGAALALAAAVCWAIFTVMARPIMLEEKALPIVTLVVGIGAVSMLVTCVSMGQSVFRISFEQISSVLVGSLICVGLMTGFWLMALSAQKAVRVAPLWYLAPFLIIVWAYRDGTAVNFWWFVGGAVLVFLGICAALSTRSRQAVSMGDILRG